MDEVTQNACHHRMIRETEFYCDGALYRALECQDCPASTSLFICDYRGYFTPEDFVDRQVSRGSRLK